MAYQFLCGGYGMPFTPLHWGYPIVFGEYFFKGDFRKGRIQFMGLLAATLPDFEGFFNIILGITFIPPHGFFHSIVGGLVLGSLLLAFTMWQHDKYKDMLVTEDDFIPRYFHPEVTPMEKVFYVTSPVLFQVMIDMFLYTDLQLFWPLGPSPNPLANTIGSELVTNLSVFMVLAAIVLFIWNIIKGLLKYINMSEYEE